MPKTPNRTFRIPEALYAQAQQLAAEKRLSMTQLVVDALNEYVRKYGRKQ